MEQSQQTSVRENMGGASGLTNGGQHENTNKKNLHSTAWPAGSTKVGCKNTKKRSNGSRYGKEAGNRTNKMFLLVSMGSEAIKSQQAPPTLTNFGQIQKNVYQSVAMATVAWPLYQQVGGCCGDTLQSLLSSRPRPHTQTGNHLLSMPSGSSRWRRRQ